MTIRTKPSFVDQIESLPPLSKIVPKLLAVTDSTAASVDEIAAVLREDQAITAKVLRVANSPFFGAGRQVIQVSRAVVRLGSIAVRNLVLGICARNAIRSATLDEDQNTILWRHAIAVASASDLIAHRLGYSAPEEAFVAGLLHDVGQLAMQAFDPTSFAAVFREQGHAVGFLSLERKHFGMDHTEAGHRILDRWGLPVALGEVALHHHEPDPGPGERTLLAMVMLADTLAQIVGLGFDFPLDQPNRGTNAAQHLGLDASDQLRILDHLERRVQEAEQMLASADAASADDDVMVARRAVWVSDSSCDQDSLGQLLLEHGGYDVQRMSRDELSACVAQDDLIVLADAQDDENEARRFVGDLSGRGCRRLVLLTDPDDRHPLRRRDPATGSIQIPCQFTAFDLKWVEQQLES